MKKFYFILMMLVSMMLTSCTLSSVDADEEGVFVKKPWFFGAEGTSNSPLTEGSEWKVFTTDFVKFKVVPIQYDESFDDIISLDNTPITCTAHALIQINRGETPILLKNFGTDWYKNLIQKDFRNEVRR